MQGILCVTLYSRRVRCHPDSQLKLTEFYIFSSFFFLLHSNRSQCRHHSGVARNYVYVRYGILAGLILSVQSNQSVQSKMQFVQFKTRNCAVQKHKVEDIIDIK